MPAAREVKIQEMPPDALRNEIQKRAKGLHRRGLLPNGLQQLVVGTYYRRDSLFADLAHTKKLFKGDPRFEEEFKKFVQEYKPYNGTNLAGTAAYQHKRYSPDDKRFPVEGTPAYTKLVSEMGEFGGYIQALEDKIGWKDMQEIIWGINRAF